MSLECAICGNAANPIVLVCRISRNSDSAIVASPNAFMMNAFFAAAIALGRSWWKPIRR